MPYIAGHGLLLQVMDKDDTMKDIAERLMSFRGMGSDFLAEARLATEDFYPRLKEQRGSFGAAEARLRG